MLQTFILINESVSYIKSTLQKSLEYEQYIKLEYMYIYIYINLIHLVLIYIIYVHIHIYLYNI